MLFPRKFAENKQQNMLKVNTLGKWNLHLVQNCTNIMNTNVNAFKTETSLHNH